MKHVLLIFLFLHSSSIGLADFINLVQADKCETIIEIFVEHDRILAKLEIGKEDYPWFSEVVPSDNMKGRSSGTDPQILWTRFMKTTFVLQSDKQTILGNIKTIERRDRIPRAGISTGQMDSTLLKEKIVYVEIDYPLSSRPQQIAISPPMEEGYPTSPANIGFIVYHKTVPVNDLRFLEAKESLYLDWEDPWYSYFENANISRHHKSSLMSFLYVEPYEVRHEILGRIKDLEDWIDLNYGMDDMIDIEEQDSIKRLIANFLVGRNIVRIEGEAREPIIDRIHFVEVNLSGIQILEIPKPIPYASAIVGIIFAYPDKGLPQEITIHWDMFNEKIQRVPCMSIDPAGPWPYDLQPSDSVLEWTNFLKHYKLPAVSEQKVEHLRMHVPLFTLVFLLMAIFVLFRNRWTLKDMSKWRKFFFVLYVVLGIMAYPVGFTKEVPFFTKKSYSVPEAKELIGQLLKNTYRAFDFRDEGDVYDKLAICNDNELLQEIYLQTRRSMLIENQGGIEAKVDEILLTNVEEEPMDGTGLAYRCNWIVKGTVGHWGHQHRRINQYDAIIKIRPVAGVWKMFDLDIIEEKRL